MKRVILFVVMALALLCPAFAQELEVQSKVTAIAVSGNKTLADSTILEPIFSRVGEILDKDKVQNDLKAIYALGYFQGVDATFEAYLDGTKIIYHVLENPGIKEIKLSGNTAYNNDIIKNTLGMKPGEIFSYKKLRDGMDAINKKYKSDGYTLAKIVDVSFEAGQIEMKIVEGIVEAVTLEGNEATKDYVIYREMDTRPGQVFNENVFAKDLRRVFNLGFFSEINPKFEPGSSSDKIILVVDIKETRTNTVNFGGGWGERDGWFGFVDLSVNNLAGTAQGLMIRGQSGQQLATYQFRYTNPWFWPEKLGPRTLFTFRTWNTLGTDIYLTQQDEWHVGWDASFGKTYKDKYGSTLSFGSEAVTPRNGATFEAYVSDYVGLSFSYDTRDYWMNPKSGVNHILSLKNGWKFASGKSNFFKIGLDLNGFRPVQENAVLAGHIGGGMGLGDIPLGELYWAGGPNTVRGYGLDEIRRGVNKILANVEYRLMFNESFQAVFFVDWGDAWTGQVPSFSDFIAGWGPGIRVNTPLGPIRLDYGVASRRPISEGILHFSVGQAF